MCGVSCLVAQCDLRTHQGMILEANSAGSKYVEFARTLGPESCDVDDSMPLKLDRSSCRR